MTERMFPFITETWNPLAGGPCPGACTYCWATQLKSRYGYEKYKGPWRIDEKAIKKRFKPGGFVFVQDMGDLWAPGVPTEVQARVLEVVASNPETRFLMMSKFPFGYRLYPAFPRNVVLGATVETNRIEPIVSRAPYPLFRLSYLAGAARFHDLPSFVSVEPIMEFDRGALLPSIAHMRPWAVAVGYDNYSNGLPEPSLLKTRGLIEALRARKITVYEKTLREAGGEVKVK